MALRAQKVSVAFKKQAPGQECCVVLLGKTLYYNSAFLHPGVQKGTDKINAVGNTAMD